MVKESVGLKLEPEIAAKFREMASAREQFKNQALLQEKRLWLNRLSCILY